MTKNNFIRSQKQFQKIEKQARKAKYLSTTKANSENTISHIYLNFIFFGGHTLKTSNVSLLFFEQINLLVDHKEANSIF